jgi:hypothetical protein
MAGRLGTALTTGTPGGRPVNFSATISFYPTSGKFLISPDRQRLGKVLLSRFGSFRRRGGQPFFFVRQFLAQKKIKERADCRQYG